MLILLKFDSCQRRQETGLSLHSLNTPKSEQLSDLCGEDMREDQENNPRDLRSQCISTLIFFLKKTKIHCLLDSMESTTKWKLTLPTLVLNSYFSTLLGTKGSLVIILRSSSSLILQQITELTVLHLLQLHCPPMTGGCWTCAE